MRSSCQAPKSLSSASNSAASLTATTYHVSLIFKWGREDDARQAAEKHWKMKVRKVEDSEVEMRKEIASEQALWWRELMSIDHRKRELIERPRYFLSGILEASARQSVMAEATLAFVAIQNQMSDAFFKLIDEKKSLLCIGARLSHVSEARFNFTVTHDADTINPFK